MMVEIQCVLCGLERALSNLYLNVVMFLAWCEVGVMSNGVQRCGVIGCELV